MLAAFLLNLKHAEIKQYFQISSCEANIYDLTEQNDLVKVNLNIELAKQLFDADQDRAVLLILSLLCGVQSNIYCIDDQVKQELYTLLNDNNIGLLYGKYFYKPSEKSLDVQVKQQFLLEAIISLDHDVSLRDILLEECQSDPRAEKNSQNSAFYCIMMPEGYNMRHLTFYGDQANNIWELTAERRDVDLYNYYFVLYYRHLQLQLLQQNPIISTDLFNCLYNAEERRVSDHIRDLEILLIAASAFIANYYFFVTLMAAPPSIAIIAASLLLSISIAITTQLKDELTIEITISRFDQKLNKLLANLNEQMGINLFRDLHPDSILHPDSMECPGVNLRMVHDKSKKILNRLTKNSQKLKRDICSTIDRFNGYRELAGPLFNLRWIQSSSRFTGMDDKILTNIGKFLFNPQLMRFFRPLAKVNNKKRPFNNRQQIK